MVIGKCTDVSRGIFGWEEGLRRGGYVGGTFHREFVMGEENFHEGSAGFSSIIKKNIEKINIKKFFRRAVRSSIKTKNGEKSLRI